MSKLTKSNKPKNNSPHLHIFIGYDDREQLEWKVFKESILDNTSKPVSIYPLKHRELRDIGLFRREWKTEANGITGDLDDKKPFSTQFAFLRFLVPAYSRYLGIKANDYSLFIDCDFISISDINNIIFEIQNDPDKAVYVVKHNYEPKNNIKMDNQIQIAYPKKLWSSFMVFNLKRPDCGPTVEEVNTKAGSWLHSFSWLSNDDQIGSLNEGWNFIPNHSEKRVKDQDIKCIHYTNGSPLMKPNCKYSGPFNNYLRQFLNKAQEDLNILI